MELWVLFSVAQKLAVVAQWRLKAFSNHTGQPKPCLKEPSPQTTTTTTKSKCLIALYICSSHLGSWHLEVEARDMAYGPMLAKMVPKTSTLSSSKATHAVSETSTLNGPFRKEGRIWLLAEKNAAGFIFLWKIRF